MHAAFVLFFAPLATIAPQPGANAPCPDGFFYYRTDFGLACQGGGTCWRQKSSGPLPGGVDGADHGWPAYFVQCERGYPALIAQDKPCPAGFDHYQSDYNLGCQGGGSCWRLKSAGPLPGGVDGAGYGWPGYLVQCAQSYPQLVERDAPCAVGFDHYQSDFGVGCGGGGSCWRLKSAGPLPGAVDAAPYGWPGYLVQCERSAPQLGSPTR